MFSLFQSFTKKSVASMFKQNNVTGLRKSRQILLMPSASRCGFVCALMLSSGTSFSAIKLSMPRDRHKFHVCSNQWHYRFSRKSLSFRQDAFSRLQLSESTGGGISLSDEIRQAYQEGETDAVINLAMSRVSLLDDANEVISACVKAAGDSKGQTAGMINAWIASCCLIPDQSLGANLALEVLEAFDEMSETRDIVPDVVTLSLVYFALKRDERREALAQTVLDRAARLSKKQAGNKRRKVLAAARRKAIVTCVQVEEKLQSLLGREFSVLQETDDIVVLNKPSGVCCFHKRSTTAGKVRKKRKGQMTEASDVSLEDALINYNVPLSTLNPESLGLVHRLDRGTSGCIVLAKTEAMHANLVSEFFLRRVQKRYLTVVSPVTKPLLTGVGDINATVAGRPAKSKFRILKYYGSIAALMELETFTGRKHQVRVHCSQALNSPVLMDTMYSDDTVPCEVDVQGVVDLDGESKDKFFLHASKLSIDEYGIDVEAPIPAWWKNTIDNLEKI